MMEQSSTEDTRPIACTPETLLGIKEQRIRQAEAQADVYLGAYLEVKSEAERMIRERDEEIVQLRRQLASVEPSES